MTHHPTNRAAVLPLARRTRGSILAALALTVLVGWPSVALAQPQDAFTRALERGPLYAALAALIGGFLVSLTPCVYPMIAITVSVFGARDAGSRGRALLLSTSFVAGIVAMFVPLGVAAGLTGSLFGSLLANRWVNVGLAVVFAAMAASMFGAFEMVLPERLLQRLGRVGGIGFGGAFLLGLVCGVVAAPCTGPVLTGILVWIGKTQSAALGAGAMMAFSIGLGIPFWLVGAFAVSLPKSGRWMMWVKSFFGIVMLVMALYFLRYAIPVLGKLVPPGTTWLLASIAVAVVGLLVGAVHLDWSDGGTGTKARKAIGIVLAVAGAFTAVVRLEAAPDLDQTATSTQDGDVPLLTFLDSEAEATALARREKRPLLVDFTADWCGACKKLTKETFSDPRVRRKAGGFVAVKIDVSVSESLPDEEQERLEATFDEVKKRYGVVGLPTVVVYDANGHEAIRLNDFVGPDEFLAKLEAAFPQEPPRAEAGAESR